MPQEQLPEWEELLKLVAGANSYNELDEEGSCLTDLHPPKL